jgi:putative intracellular protease/amidase
MAKVLVPLPDRDFDVTEVSVPWKLLNEAGHEVVFATEHGGRGDVPAADPLLLRGVIFGQLGAKPDAKAFYEQLSRSSALSHPISWAEIDPAEFDALLLPGGHAPGMKQYLASDVLQSKVIAFDERARRARSHESTKRPKPVIAAICHGVLVLARAVDPQTGKSVLHGRRTTCLPKYMERLAYSLTSWKLGRYYRTYDAYVEDEVRAALEDPTHFVRGPITLGSHGTRDDDGPAFIVEDGALLSARWPGDAYLFAKKLLARL